MANIEQQSPEERVKEHARYCIKVYAGCNPKATKGLFWKIKLQTELAMDFDRANYGIPGELKEALGNEIANNLYRDETARIIANKKLLNEVVNG